MIATEKDAREGWWCPMARVVHTPFSGGVAVANRNVFDAPALERASRCLASECALWRWRERALDHHGRPRTDRRGFCGLAAVSD